MKRGSLTVIGSGHKLIAQMTSESVAYLQAADKVFYAVDPVTAVQIQQLNPHAKSLADCYAVGKNRQDSYDEMVDRVLSAVRDNFSHVKSTRPSRASSASAGTSSAYQSSGAPKPRPAADRSTLPSHMIRSITCARSRSCASITWPRATGRQPASMARDHAPVSLMFWTNPRGVQPIAVAPIPTSVRAESLV